MTGKPNVCKAVSDSFTCQLLSQILEVPPLRLTVSGNSVKKYHEHFCLVVFVFFFFAMLCACRKVESSWGKQQKEKWFSNISLQKLNKQWCQMMARNKTSISLAKKFSKKISDMLSVVLWWKPPNRNPKLTLAINCQQLRYWNNWDPHKNE